MHVWTMVSVVCTSASVCPSKQKSLLFCHDQHQFSYQVSTPASIRQKRIYTYGHIVPTLSEVLVGFLSLSRQMAE